MGGSFKSFSLVPRAMNEKLSVEVRKRVEEIQTLYELVKIKIEKSNASYQAQVNKHKRRAVFQPRYLVCIHLRKVDFASKCKNELMARLDGLFKVLEKVNENAYKINLPKDYEVSVTFNVADLTLFPDDDHLSN